MTQNHREVVDDFFSRMENDVRRSTVGELFADDAVISLSGITFAGPDAASEMLAWLAPRYEWAAKEFDDWIETDTVVVSQGTLYGVDKDGNRFEDIRYIDVYRFKDGKIARVDIYNDLADEGVCP